MRLNRFDGGYSKKRFKFPAAGRRILNIKVPSGMQVQHVSFELEGSMLNDVAIAKVGVVSSSTDFKVIRTMLQGLAPAVTQLTKGFGPIGPLTTRKADECDLVVVHIDEEKLQQMSEEALQEHDVFVVAIPLKPREVSRVLGSDRPLIILDQTTALNAGLGTKVTLEADMETLHSKGIGSLVKGMGEGFIDLQSGSRSVVPFVPKKAVKVPVVALNPGDSTPILDTGQSNQAVVLTSNLDKMVYFGCPKVKGISSSPVLTDMFRRMVHWCGEGGVPEKVRITIGNEVVHEDPGKLDGTIAVASDSTHKGHGEWVLPVELRSEAPGYVTVSSLEVIAKRLVQIRRFSSGPDMELDLGDVDTSLGEFEVPSNAKVLKAAMTLEITPEKQIVSGWDLELSMTTLTLSPDYVVSLDLDQECSGIRLLVSGGPAKGNILIGKSKSKLDIPQGMNWVHVGTGKCEPGEMTIEVMEGEAKLHCSTTSGKVRVKGPTGEFEDVEVWPMLQLLGEMGKVPDGQLLIDGRSIQVGLSSTGKRMRLTGLQKAITTNGSMVSLHARLPVLGRARLSDLYVECEIEENEDIENTGPTLKDLKFRAQQMVRSIELLEQELASQGIKDI